MSDRIRAALLVLVLVAFFAARAGGALGARARAHVHAHVHARTHIHVRARSHVRVSHATRVAREQARVVRFARRFLGTRYLYGGTTPGSGFDCSGFTRFVYAHFGITLPHYSGAQFGLGRRVARGGLRPGDLVFFDGLGHVGLYIGNGRFIHAPHTGTRVSIASLAGWYSTRYDGARRLL